NQADHAVYSTEKAIQEYGEKLGASEKEKIQAAVENLKKVKDSGKADEIKRAIEELNKTMHDFSKTLYEEAAKKRAAEQPQPSASPNGEEGPARKGDGSGGDEKIIDADFKTK